MKKNWILSWDLKRIIKSNLPRLLRTSLIVAFLFYLLNIFTAIGFKINDISTLVTDKVGMYFYINDNVNQEEIYSRVIDIKDELSQKWLETSFSSKDDAFNFLENKIPEITENFDKFGIDNPLPSTLYIMFDNEKEYNIMKEVILKNKDMVLNIQDIDEWATLQQQENRSLKILKIIRDIQYSVFFILIIIWLIVITFTQHLLRNFFFDFYKELEIKKLLWATHKAANSGFILTLLFIITAWFIVWFILTCLSLNILDANLVSLWVDLNLCNVIPSFFIWYVIFGLIATLLWYQRLNKLERKF